MSFSTEGQLPSPVDPATFHEHLPATRIGQIEMPGDDMPSADLFYADDPAPLRLLPVLPTHLLAISLRGSVRGHYQLAEQPPHDLHITDGVTAFLEARCQWKWGWEDGLLKFLCVYLPPSFLYRVAETNGWETDGVNLPRTFVGRDELMAYLAAALAHELATEPTPFRLLVMSLVETLTLRLLDGYSTSNGPADTTGPLSRPMLREVRAFVRTHLGHPIMVEDMAHRVDLSTSYFSRLFKETTGMPPYEYVLRERIEEAKRLLRTTDRTIASIAYATGFSNQSHLTRRFRKTTGMTPGAYREAVQ